MIIFVLFKNGKQRQKMATLKYILRTKNENANIFIRYSINRETRLIKKTNFIIDANDWSESKAQPLQRDEALKKLSKSLDDLKKFISDAYNDATPKGIEITGDWLQTQIDIFNNKTPVVELDLLTNYIKKYIDEAPYKTNQQGGFGLSVSRVKNMKLFLNTILKYEATELIGKSIVIKDINIQFAERFKMHLLNKGYAINYVGKNISNLLTICNDAKRNDIETSTQTKNIKSLAERKAPEDIIFLNETEQEQIKNTPLLREALINARKFLLLGCLIGQRGGDLLSITASNIKDLSGIKIIELKQQKTGKLVAIPLLPEAIEIIESGLPYKISLTHFNLHIKDICKIAGIDAPTKGRKKTTKGNPTIKGTYPKHEVISSHICRRSFATNFYGRIPTPVLMNITAHGTEKMYLQYIGKTTYDNAFQMLEYFSKLKPKERTAPTLEVVRNVNVS